MASMGEGTIDHWYADLDSWRIAGDGSAGYVHNTSGARKTRLSEHDRHVEPYVGEEPIAWAGDQGGSGGQQAAAPWEGSEAGPSTASYDDASHFSQVSSPLAGEGVDFGGYAEEGTAEYVDDGDDDDDTVVGPVVKRLVVTIKKNRLNRHLYFVDAKGKDRTTSRDEWRKVDGGYELACLLHQEISLTF